RSESYLSDEGGLHLSLCLTFVEKSRWRSRHARAPAELGGVGLVRILHREPGSRVEKAAPEGSRLLSCDNNQRHTRFCQRLGKKPQRCCQSGASDSKGPTDPHER